MIQSGQVSRIHQISEDGKKWDRASSFDQFFDSFVDVVPLQKADGQSQNSESQQPAEEWYYSHQNRQFGPIPFEQLRQVASTGQLLSTDLVWCDKLTDWQAASTIEGLFPAANSAQAQPAQQAQHQTAQHQSAQPQVQSQPVAYEPAQTVSQMQYPSNEPLPSFQDPMQTSVGGGIAPESVLAISKSRPWLMFSGIGFVLFGLTAIVGGFILAIVGAGSRNYTLITEGVMCVLLSGIFLFGSYFAFRLSSMAGRCVNAPTATNLNYLLKSNKSFWVFSSISLVCYLILTIIGVVIIFVVTTYVTEATTPIEESAQLWNNVIVYSC